MRTIQFYLHIYSTLISQYFRVRNMEKKIKRGTLSLTESYAKWDEVGSEFCRKLFEISKTEITIKGIENIKNGPYLFVGNHQGNLDIPLLFHCSPLKMAFIAKKELDSMPFFGRIARSRGMIFMDRKSARGSIKSINEGISFLKAGNSLAIFPEGTRSKENSVGEFKAGGLRLGMKSKVPIIPFVISGSYRVLEEGKGRITPSKVSFTFLEEVDTSEFKDASELSNHIRNLIINELKVES